MNDLAVFMALQELRIRQALWQRPTSAARPEGKQADVLLWATPERQDKGRNRRNVQRMMVLIRRNAARRGYAPESQMTRPVSPAHVAETSTM